MIEVRCPSLKLWCVVGGNDELTPPRNVSVERSDLDRPLTVLVRRGAETSSVLIRPWEAPNFVVGRRTDCDLCLDDPTVSARHLYLQKLPGRIAVFDLGSRDFRKRRGILGRPKFFLVDQLRPGDEVQVGDFWLSVTGENPLSEGEPFTGESEQPASDTEGPVSSAIPHSVSNGLDGNPLPRLAEPVAVWELTEPGALIAEGARPTIQHEVMLIGRGPQCGLKLDHETVSTTHASLVFSRGTLHVFDLCSRYGVQVNGRLVKSAQLTDGDELAVGECRGVIRWLAPPVHPVEILPIAEQSETFSCATDFSRDIPINPRDCQAQEIALAEPLAHHAFRSDRAESMDSAWLLAMPEIDATSEASRDDSLDSDFDDVADSLCTDSLCAEPSDTLTERAESLPPETSLSDDVAVDLQSLISQCAEQQVQVREQARLLLELVQGRLNTPGTPHVEPAPAAKPPRRLAPINTAPINTAPTDSPQPPADTNAELHVWLNQRLAGLDGEPSSHWRQFWKTLTGMF